MFTKCGDSLESGRRLENLSWRLWFREAHLLPPDASSDFDISNSTDCTSTPLESNTPIGTPRTSRSASLNLVAAGINAAFAPPNNRQPTLITQQQQLQSSHPDQLQDLSDPESGNWSSEESDADEEERKGKVREGLFKGEQETKASTSTDEIKRKIERGNGERIRGRSSTSRKAFNKNTSHQTDLQPSNSAVSTSNSSSKSHPRTSSSASNQDSISEVLEASASTSTARPRYGKHASFDVEETEPSQPALPFSTSSPTSTSLDTKSQSTRTTRPLSSASAFGSRARVRQRNQSLSGGAGGSAAAARRRRPLSFGEAVESLALGLDGGDRIHEDYGDSYNSNTSNWKGKGRAKSALGITSNLNSSASHSSIGKNDGMTTNYESENEEIISEKERLERERMPPPSLPGNRGLRSTSAEPIYTTASTQERGLKDKDKDKDKGKSKSKFFVGSCASHDSGELIPSPAPSPSLTTTDDQDSSIPSNVQQIISNQSNILPNQSIHQSTSQETGPSQLPSNNSNPTPTIQGPSSRRTSSDTSSVTSEQSTSGMSKKSVTSNSNSNLSNRRSKSGTALHKAGHGHPAHGHGRKSSGSSGLANGRNTSFLRGMTGLTAMTKVEKPGAEKKKSESSSKLKGMGNENTSTVAPVKEDKMPIPQLQVAAPTPAPSPPPSIPATSENLNSLNPKSAEPSTSNQKAANSSSSKKPVKFTMGCDEESEEEWSEDEDDPRKNQKVEETKSKQILEKEKKEEQIVEKPQVLVNASKSKQAEVVEEEEVEEGEDDSDWSSDEPTAEELQAEKEAAAAQRRADEEARQKEMFQKRPIRSASATDVRKMGLGGGLRMSGMPSANQSATPSHPNPSPPAQPVRGFLSSLFHPEQEGHPPPGQLAGRPHASAANLRSGISSTHKPQEEEARLSKLEEIDENDPHHKQRRRNRMIRESHHQREKSNRKANSNLNSLMSTSSTSRPIGEGGLKTSKSAVALPVLNTVASSSSIRGMNKGGNHSGGSTRDSKEVLSKSHSRSRSKDREDDRRDGQSTFSRRDSGGSSNAQNQHRRSSSSGNGKNFHLGFGEDEEEEESEDEIPQPSSLALAKLSQLAKKKTNVTKMNSNEGLPPFTGGSTATAKARKRNSVSTLNSDGSGFDEQTCQQQQQVQPQPKETFKYTNDSMFRKQAGSSGSSGNSDANQRGGDSKLSNSSGSLATQAIPSQRVSNSTGLQQPVDTAQPQTPRTTRRNMLRDELSESLRQNLLWERQSRNRMLGIGGNQTTSSTNLQQQQFQAQQAQQQQLLLQQQQQQQMNNRNTSVLGGNNLRPLTPSTTTSTQQQQQGHQRNGSTSSNQLKRNQSTDGGFHHSGW